jgi:hypothetical protein
MGAQITPMKNGDPYESPFFIGVICAPIGVFYVPMQLRSLLWWTRLRLIDIDPVSPGDNGHVIGSAGIERTVNQRIA